MIYVGVGFVLFLVFCIATILRPFVEVSGQGRCVNVTYTYLGPGDVEMTATKVVEPRIRQVELSFFVSLFSARAKVYEPNLHELRTPYGDYLTLNGSSVPCSRLIQIDTEWGEVISVTTKAQLPLFGNRVSVYGPQEYASYSDWITSPISDED